MIFWYGPCFQIPHRKRTGIVSTTVRRQVMLSYNMLYTCYNYLQTPGGKCWSVVSTCTGTNESIGIISAGRMEHKQLIKSRARILNHQGQSTRSMRRLTANKPKSCNLLQGLSWQGDQLNRQGKWPQMALALHYLPESASRKTHKRTRPSVACLKLWQKHLSPCLLFISLKPLNSITMASAWCSFAAHPNFAGIAAKCIYNGDCKLS